MSPCIFCLTPHDTGLKLCPQCEQTARRLKARDGEPVKFPRIKTNGEKPDD